MRGGRLGLQSDILGGLGKMCSQTLRSSNGYLENTSIDVAKWACSALACIVNGLRYFGMTTSL